MRNANTGAQALAGGHPHYVHGLDRSAVSWRPPRPPPLRPLFEVEPLPRLPVPSATRAAGPLGLSEHMNLLYALGRYECRIGAKAFAPLVATDHTLASFVRGPYTL